MLELSQKVIEVVRHLLRVSNTQGSLKSRIKAAKAELELKKKELQTKKFATLQSKMVEMEQRF